MEGKRLTPRGSWEPTTSAAGKTCYTKEIKSFLWDSPELRRAFREAKEKETLARKR